MTHTLPELPYSYDALEPHIDARTMEIHHSKHHQAYVDNLTKALETHPDLLEKDLKDLLKDPSSLPDDIRTAVINHGGGHLNHSLFWTMLSPVGGGQPEGELLDRITAKFGAFDQFKVEFTKVAMSRFGSGWAWLVLSGTEISIQSTPNQETPISAGLIPLLTLDVWEHAYYLNYQNRRADYIASWWNVVNWKECENIYKENT